MASGTGEVIIVLARPRQARFEVMVRLTDAALFTLRADFGLSNGSSDEIALIQLDASPASLSRLLPPREPE